MMWEFQRYELEALFKYHFVNVWSCRSSGKSHNACEVIIPTFLLTAPSVVLVLAPIKEQIWNVLWPKIRDAKLRAHLPGRIGKQKWELDADHFAVGLASKNPDNLRGYHAGIIVPPDPDADMATADELQSIFDATGSTAKRLLIYVDEPQGIGEETFRVLRGMYGKPNVYVLMHGNPYLGMDDDHEYVRAADPESRWHNIQISALTDDQVVARGGVPNKIIADKQFHKVPEYLGWSQDQIEEQLRDFELTDPFIMSDVLGRFADGSVTSLVCPRHILEAGMIADRDHRKLGPRIGVDIGVTGDSTVATLMYHGVVKSVKEWRPGHDDKQAQVSIAEEIVRLSEGWGHQLGEKYTDWDDETPIPGWRISIDDTALVGVCDILGSMGVFVDRVNFGSAEEYQWLDLVGDQEFKNIRAEMHWVARRGLQEGVFRVPRRFKRIWQQAQWAHFVREPGKDGTVIKIELKELITKAHGRSPDNWDSFILACRQVGEKVFFDASYYDKAAVGARVLANRAKKRLPGGRRITL